MSQLGRRSPTRARPAGEGAGVLERQSGLDRARSDRVLEGLRRDDLFTVVLEQFMTDTAAHADVVLPATTQLEHLDVRVLLGPPRYTFNEPRDRAARGGQAEHGGVPADRRAAWDSTTRASPRPTRSCSTSCSRTLPTGRRRGLRTRGFAKVDLGQGPTPHAEGGGTATASRLRRGSRRGHRPLPHYDPPAEVADADSPRGSRWRWSPQDAPLPQLDVRQPGAASTARSPSRSWCVHPDDAAAAACRTAPGAGLQRPRVVLCAARV